MTASRLFRRRCIVTGGSSANGIGLAVARRFAAEGAERIILVGRSQEKLDRLRHEQDDGEKKKNNDRSSAAKGVFEYVAGDVGTPECWDTLKREMPNVDILVNAAGITQTSHLFRTSNEDIESIVRTNLIGTMLGCKVIGKTMALNARKEGPGSESAASIINISSLLGLRGGQGATVYAATKAGVVGLTRALVDEMQDLIRINAIVPGFVDTNMLDGLSASTREKLVKQIPLKRLGTIDEIADAAVFLASNRYANNCILNLDGGLSAV